LVSPSSPSDAPLDVPYLAQSELLCGGAALAMVERWWGHRGVYAQDFLDLVRPAARGILTTDLAEAARRRGWKVRTFDGTPELVRRSLDQRQPVIALLEVAPQRFHYVVLLSWSGGRVHYHDPARGPDRSLTEPRFLRSWDGGDRWAMVVTPDDGATAVLPTAAPAADSSAISASSATSADSSASSADSSATSADDPLTLLRLAGVRFRQHRFADAVGLSSAYVARVPTDTLGWQTLAASHYLAGERGSALAAWNRTGTPRVDLLRIDGLHQVRFGIAADAIHTPDGSLLTPHVLALARRRLADLPALRRATVEYRPIAGGRVEVRASVTERPVLDPIRRLLAVGALRALVQREVTLVVATPTGAGELWSANWRWEHAHPRVDLDVDLPLRRGTLSLEGTWERFRFRSDTAAAGRVEASRHATGIGFGTWVSPSLRPSAGIGLERWSGKREFLALWAGTDFRTAADRLVLNTELELGQSLLSSPSYLRGRLGATWASTLGIGRASWSTNVGVELVSARTPLGLWPVASGDLAWAIPLRAHPRQRDGLLPGATSGRSMFHGGLSGDQPFYRMGPFTFALGLFLDGAEVLHPIDGSGRDRFFLDAGGGLRIGLVDGQLGVLRIDLATGLTDRSTALTAGLHQSWPPLMNRSR
jgi:hypothetical protein